MKEIWDAKTNEELCLEYQQTNNEDLYKYFLKRNYKLIYKYFNKYISEHLDEKDEMLQQGEIAIWEAMKNFKQINDYKFTTYVYYFFKKNAWHHLYEKRQVGYNINYMGKLKELKKKEPFIVTEICSLDKVLYTSNDEFGTTLMANIAIDKKDVLDEVIEKEDYERIISLIKKVLKPSEYKCIVMRYGLNGDNPKTLQQIGNIYNLSRERIRQIIDRSLDKIRRKYNKEDL